MLFQIPRFELKVTTEAIIFKSYLMAESQSNSSAKETLIHTSLLDLAKPPSLEWYILCAPGHKNKSLKAVTIEDSDDGGNSWIPQGSISYPDVV